MRIFLHCNVASISFLMFFAWRAPKAEKSRFLYWHIFLCVLCVMNAPQAEKMSFLHVISCVLCKYNFIHIEGAAGGKFLFKTDAVLSSLVFLV